MKSSLFIGITILLVTSLFAQEKKDTLTIIPLKSVDIQVERYNKSTSKSTQKIESISQKEIEFQNYQTTADMLSNSGILAVQKSQQGGGSPIIRGFEANKILLLVDGIRMNNLIFRGGHLQNVITVDENMLESTDVLFGSASTLFGSDALGGAINLKTKNPLLLAASQTQQFSGTLNVRGSTVNRERSSHFDLNYASKRWASLTSISNNHFGDLRMGAQKNGSNDYFGERPYYVQEINNTDILVNNPNPLVQKYSGYNQINLMQKVLFKQNEKTLHLWNLQYSTTGNIPRYDRLTDVLGTNLKYARWDYGPQVRFLGAYTLSKKNFILNSDFNLGVNVQHVEESRITRKFNNDNTKKQLEKVNVIGITTDFRTHLGKGELLYGAEMYYDHLNSSATSNNRNTGISSIADSRYPNGENHTLRTEAFATLTLPISKQMYYNAGARTGYVSLFSTIDDNSIFNLPFQTIAQNNFTYSGTTGMVHNAKYSKIALNVSSAYRVPNIDDLSKVFESGGGILIVPNPNLKPEKTLSTDLAISLFDGKYIRFETNLFYTKLFDAIVTDHFLFQGQSDFTYDGTLSTVMANQNLGKATLWGANSKISIQITKKFQYYGTLSITKGQINTVSGNTPLDHIPPLYGKTGILFASSKLTLDGYFLFNGKKDISEYFLNGEDNEQYAPVGGMPAWYIFSLKGSYQISKPFTVYAGIENIMDIQYRTFASGINSPGRNFYLGLNYKF